MTDIATPEAPASPPSRPPWDYFSTLGWVVLAHVIGSIAGVAAVFAWNPASLGTLADFGESLKDGWLFSLSTIVAAPVMVVILFAVVRLRRWTLRDYFAFTWPERRQIVIALAALAVTLPALDAVAWLSGQQVVTDFQKDLYESAQRSRTLVLLWIALVAAAPLWEEIAFRGFIYRGWVRSERHAMPGILIISAFFAILHLQYNWFGMLQVFALGLLFGWARWYGRSTYLTIAMHAATNFYSTMQTVAVLKWMS